MINILLAEDHRIVREGFRALLASEPQFSIVGEASDGLEVLKLAGQLRPDLVVMDLIMPNLNGLEATRQLCRRNPHPKVVILSMHAGEAYVLAALRHGASAYVLKDSGSQDLINAVHAVMAGRRYFSPPLSEAVIEEYIQKTSETGTLDLYDTLTNREREVLQLCAEGNTNMQIGAKLFISHRTVETHRANLMQKLGLRSHTDLIRYSLQKGILPLTQAAL